MVFLSLARTVFKFLCSLKLAVLVMVGLTLSMVVATFLESIYDTPTAQYWVYQSAFFYTLLGLLAVLIFCVAMSRYPWKRKHGPFLMAHAGILILLFGSLLTFKVGLDGSMRISEGETQAVVELQNLNLVLAAGSTVKSFRIPWTPPNARFKPISIPQHRLVIDQFIAHAEPVFDFKPLEDKKSDVSHPAVKIRLQGGPMRITQDFWLWTGDPGWTTTQAGPARLNLGPPIPQATPPPPGQPVFTLLPASDGSIAFEARSSQGAIKKGRFKADSFKGQVIEPGWKGGVTLTILEWIPRAQNLVTYQPAETQYGDRAPPSAIHLVGGEHAQVWLGFGDRASFIAGGKTIAISYQPSRVVLPFGIELDRFILEHYEGTLDPSRYSSIVKVKDSGREPTGPVEITMNEPLHYQGITFYQASYEDAKPRPTTTILSVNRDPGRPYKYGGSLLIVLGAIGLFASKYRKKSKSA